MTCHDLSRSKGSASSYTQKWPSLQMPRCYSMILMLFRPMWSYVMLCDATSLTRKNAYSTSTGIKANDAHLWTGIRGHIFVGSSWRRRCYEHTYVCLTAPVGLGVRQFNSIWHVLGQYCLLSTIKHHPSQLYQCCLQLDVGQNWVPNNGTNDLQHFASKNRQALRVLGHWILTFRDCKIFVPHYP